VNIFTLLAENASPTLREQLDRIILVSNGVIGLASETLVESDIPPVVVDSTSTARPMLTPQVTQLIASPTITLPTAVPTSTVPDYELLPTSTDLIVIEPATTPTPTVAATVVASDDGEEDQVDKEDKEKDKDKDKDLPVPPRRPINPPGLNK
jgi:hypothetical protein